MKGNKHRTFKIERTGFLLRERNGDYIVFDGSLTDLRAYRAWYRAVNKQDVSIVDHNVFIVEKEKESSDET